MKEQELQKLNNKILEEHKDKEIVLGDGTVDSSIILVGEAPGANEVKLKKPFVGQAGKHLEEFLDILELQRKELYITNTVKFRPTRISKKTGRKINRAPSKKAIESFKEYLLTEIDIIKPDFIVTLGNIPLKTLVEDSNVKIGELHGKLQKVCINNKEYILFPLYHPAAVIYRKELKEVYYNDLYKLKEVLKKKVY
ncbi:uracil-DNA glycosylase [Caldisalinibacter kiritimatiensis]|uniref:Type-4 uracil-DNA glycosylase n=1 Tax=Caldisalinibacter kiritimatiensis TaxID=1304284 RepID=R1ATM3_9FIRM|nr:uracil-DNA glycosylase [Caldisalinibacter kiritimatiensis]EOC99976.1 Uracil-DNA glycosylase superfamily [Caldisalinibacter kiritimatiensis]